MDTPSTSDQQQPSVEIVTGTPEKKPFQKQVGDLCKTSKRAGELAVKHNIPIPEAFQLVTGRLPDPRTVKRIEKGVEEWSLRHPDSLKAASKTIRDFASGKAVGEVKPNASAVLAAAQRIVDASEPVVKQSMNLNVNVEVDHPFDLNLFKR